MNLYDFYFLGLNLGFWFLGLPVGILLIYVEHIDRKDEKKRKEELVSRLPNVELRFDINKEERWMLDRLRRMSKYSTDDKFLRNEIKGIIENEINDFSEELDI